MYNYDILELSHSTIQSHIIKRISKRKIDEDCKKVKTLLSLIHSDHYSLMYPYRSKEDTRKVISKLTMIFKQLLLARDYVNNSQVPIHTIEFVIARKI